MPRSRPRAGTRSTGRARGAHARSTPLRRTRRPPPARSFGASAPAWRCRGRRCSGRGPSIRAPTRRYAATDSAASRAGRSRAGRRDCRCSDSSSRVAGHPTARRAPLGPGARSRDPAPRAPCAPPPRAHASRRLRSAARPPSSARPGQRRPRPRSPAPGQSASRAAAVRPSWSTQASCVPRCSSHLESLIAVRGRGCRRAVPRGNDLSGPKNAHCDRQNLQQAKGLRAGCAALCGHCPYAESRLLSIAKGRQAIGPNPDHRASPR